MSDQLYSAPKRSWKGYAMLIMKGMCMGAADVVPGVSGGTMAFILGIYEELIESVKTCGSAKIVKNIVCFQWRQVWRDLPWKFLVAVGSGIALAVLSLAHILEELLVTYPLEIWSFFFGLVLASVFLVAKRIREWHIRHALAIAIGTLIGYVLVAGTPVETPETWWFLILSGAIAICAMILPGISGSFVLLLLGKYQFILEAVNRRDIATIGLVGIGAVIGLLLFSKVLSWLLHRYHDRTVSLLTGLMLGSLYRIWPWKTDGITSANVLPSVDSELWIGIGFIIFGMVIVIGIEVWANWKNEALRMKNEEL